ncbi:MAG: hypothetical protein LBK56_01045 [Gracilibacteraceae bacterium]|jgi:hypothetical protein|nr:hypothetical protein [Gracilibacteraceae bacterium]
MKKRFVIFMLTVFLLAVPFALTAAQVTPSEGPVLKTLSPAAPYQNTLNQASLMETNDGYVVNVSGTLNPEDPIYEVVVSPETLTYQIVYPAILYSSESDSGTGSRPTTGNNLTINSRAQTVDTLDINLCSTTVQLKYNNNGTAITPVSRSVSVTDYSGITHWYCTTKSVSGSGNYASASAEHYNTDFIVGGRVDVSHSVSISITPGGTINWAGQATITGGAGALLWTRFQPIY